MSTIVLGDCYVCGRPVESDGNNAAGIIGLWEDDACTIAYWACQRCESREQGQHVEPPTTRDKYYLTYSQIMERVDGEPTAAELEAYNASARDARFLNPDLTSQGLKRS